MDSKSIFFYKIKVISIFILSFILVFMLFRIYSIFFINKIYFQGISLQCLLINIIHGIRFDLYVVGVFIMPVLLFLFIPIKKAGFFKIIIFITMLIYLFLCILNYADIQFFKHFHQHMSVEIFTAVGHISFLFSMVIKNYLPFILLSLIVLIGLTYLFNKYISNTYVKYFSYDKISKKTFILVLIGYILSAFIFIRGNIDPNDRPIRSLDANLFSSNCSVGGGGAADIALNGVFSVFEAVRLMQDNRNLYFTFDENLKNLQNNLITNNEKQVDLNYPFVKKRINFSMPEYNNINFVVIVLESFDRDLMDLHPEAVPFFNNEIKKNGVYFTNAFSSGRRSLMGLQSLMLSIPYIQGLPPLNSGLESKEFTRIGNLLKQNNYHTLYIANEPKTQERIAELVKYFNISEFYSLEDIPVLYDYPAFEKGYDIDGLEFFLEKINNIKGNFAAFFWTTSTHLPYNQVLSDKFKIYNGDTTTEQYLNRLRYSDYALENFFQKSKNMPWFKNTVFILVPDHRAVIGDRKPTRESIGEEYFSSFISIYAPYILEPEINQTYCNIGDIIPTIIDLAHIEKEYASFYTSLFDKDRKNFTFIYGEDNNIYIFAPEYRSIININKLELDNISNLDKTAVSLGEMLYTTIKNNKFVSKQ